MSLGIIRLLETGIVDINTKRFREAGGRFCRPTLKSQQINPLSLKKLIFIFAFLLLAIGVSCLVFGFEVVSCKQTRQKHNGWDKTLQYLDEILRIHETCKTNQNFSKLMEQLALEVGRRRTQL